MLSVPVLLVAYNRPERFKQLISSLRNSKPPTVLIAIDGPKPGNLVDIKRVSEVRCLVNEIDWTDDVEVRVRPHNFGLRAAMVDAISWGISMKGRLIIVEDDVVVGPNFLEFCNIALDKYESNPRIGQINGWNQVPHGLIDRNLRKSDCLISVYNSSFAWATWADRWSLYDDSISWGLNSSLREIKEITGSLSSALQWRLNFKNASELLVDSWSYRWLASLWSQRMWCVSPTQSLVTYEGHFDGTHTRLKVKQKQNPVYNKKFKDFVIPVDNFEVDPNSETWLRKVYFDDSFKGLLKTISFRQVLRILKYFKR